MEENKLYYVAIGASAGGLEALEAFFKNVPAETNLVYIVIQHLSPDHKSLMNELLARYTNMPIHIIKDGMATKPNNIYLIPPRKNLSIFHGKLFLEDIENSNKLNLPIDNFFRSLALDQEDHAIGIILSGTGSDGTLGIRSIKEKGGLLLVQDELSAKFDGMPLSSIATGLVDFILPPEKMPKAIIDYLIHSVDTSEKRKNSALTDDMDLLTKVTIILRDYSGIDFSYYKQNTIARRLDRRTTINQVVNPNDYLFLLQNSEKEKEILYREMLIGVTAFFRDKEAFESLKKNVIPHLPYEKKLLRIWITACSTGEEVYSIAILIQEYISENKLDCEVKIFATDIDRFAIERAGAGLYPDSVLADVEADLLSKYFIKKEGGYQINETIRKMIVFARHNVIKDPPFSRLDLIVCRNLFIYLNPKIQQKILSKFYFSLKNKGFLFMGSSESIGEMSQAFDVVDAKWKIFQRKEGYTVPSIDDLDSLPQRLTTMQKEDKIPTKGTARMENILIEAMKTSMPPSIIVDENDKILQMISDVNSYLTYPSGRFSNNLYDNVSKELGVFVSNALRTLKNKSEYVIIDSIKGLKNHEDKIISIKGYRINDINGKCFLISFLTHEAKNDESEDLSESIIDINSNEQIIQLETELQLAKESLQATVEELETSNEELQSSNEELIASNEELQSTNEELQSVNEELYTVNNEYQQKIEELSAANNDLSNLLNNIDVGALYLDHKLCIRKITPILTQITNIRDSDLGRPISHISIFKDQIDIIKDIMSVVESLTVLEREIVDNKARSWLVVIKPYRTEYNATSGILVTFSNISNIKKEIQRTLLANRRLDEIMDFAQAAWWEWNIETGFVAYDDLKATMLGYTPEEFPKDVYEICNLIHPEDYEKTMQIMRDHLDGKTEIWDTTYRIKCKDGSYKIYHDQGKVNAWDEKGKPIYAKGIVINVSDGDS